MPLYFWTGAEISNINLIFTQIPLKNGCYIEYFLYALFGYFLLRYWQYYKQEKRAIFGIANIFEAMHKIEKLYFWKKIKHKIEIFEKNKDGQYGVLDFKYIEDLATHTHLLNFEQTQYQDTKVKRADLSKSLKVSLLKREIAIVFRPDTIKFARYFQDSIKDGFTAKDIAEIDEHWSLCQENIDHVGGLPIIETTASYNPIIIWLKRKKITCQFFLAQTYFTDYYLPFVIALSSAGITLPKIIN